MKYAYFQGCSLESTAIEFHLSTAEVCRALEVELVEFDWCCCGASSAHMTDPLTALALPALNLAKAEALGLDMVIPCAACYNRESVVNKELKEDAALLAKINELTEVPYHGNVQTFSLLDVLANKVPEAALKAKVVKPLAGLKVASYYGCLLVRPPEACNFDDRENPTSMDRLVERLGGEPVPWGFKTWCCGASLALSRTDLVEKRCERLAQAARHAGANCVAVCCPLCHANVDGRSGDQSLPVLYVTQLLGLALGLDHKKLGADRHITDCRPLLRERALI